MDHIDHTDRDDCFETEDYPTKCTPMSNSLQDEAHSNFRRYFAQVKGNSLVKRYQYSLHPDLVNGWRSKHALFSIPIIYFNQQVDTVLNTLKTDDRYSIAHIGVRHRSSVQINHSNSYNWKHRQSNLENTILEEKRRCPDLRPVSKEAEVRFQSDFQGGNLDLAIRAKKNQYDLFLRSDTNTRGHSNWYYFRVYNLNQLGQITFNICNLTKPRNLYNSGMKPYTRNADGEQWTQQNCTEVFFGERFSRYEIDTKRYNLQFKYRFRQKQSWVQIAYAIPYTYTMLESLISRLVSQDNPIQPILKVTKLCDSLGGLSVPLLTITSAEENQRQKKVVLITGRIHPGQSNASHVLEGLIKGLFSKTPQTNLLLSNTIFHIVPMINPDGVVAGNFRTSLSGRDLNRQYNRLSHDLFPQITSLSQFATELKKTHQKRFRYYFDFHGHSAKKGMFCYGPEHLPTREEYFKSRTLAKLIEKSTPIFSYRSSIFSINPHKKSTGRAHMLWDIRVPMSYTFETSNGLYEHPTDKHALLTRKIMLEAGKGVLDGLIRYTQIQLKMPRTITRAKVDSHRRHKDENKQNKGRTNSSDCTSRNSQKEENKQTMLDAELKQIIRDIKDEIKEKINEKELNELNEEAGSDSQDSSEDLPENQHCQLREIIMTKKIEPKYEAIPQGPQPQLNQDSKPVYRIRKSKPMLKKKQDSLALERMGDNSQDKPIIIRKPLFWLNLENNPKKCPLVVKQKWPDAVQKQIHVVNLSMN